MKKKKIKLSPQQIADLVNQSLMEDSLVLAATQRGVGGSVEDFEVEERARRMEEKARGRKKARGKRKAGRKGRRKEKRKARKVRRKARKRR